MQFAPKFLVDRFEKAAFGLLGVAVVATYVAAFSGIEFAVAARPGPEDFAARALTLIKAPAGIPALTGPAVQDLVGLARVVTDPVLVPDSSALIETFSAVGYSLAAVQDGAVQVPRLYLTSLPHDLSDLTSVSARKVLYIKLILPLVLRANEQILEDRARAEGHIARLFEGKRLRPADAAWLTDMTQRYRVAADDFDGLLLRLDAVPPSLAVAQSIEESGWGTSRFALQGNAVFGQWTFTDGAGIVPARRDDGANHEVRSFDHLHQSVKLYLQNLNRHRAYRKFRTARAAMRAAGQPLDGYALAETLVRYSERGEDYIGTLQLLMRSNGLGSLDSAELRN
ncbi:MAG TPA: glucosaminidase domain-containing protein [Alphaproteobacteria bacterium]|nr:glucosaminidase domain-containing protein [Alphaproteobacteria bacterium]